MNTWVLIIAMLSPGGDFISKQAIEVKTRTDCEKIRDSLVHIVDPMGVKHKGICVTMDHWKGKKIMKDIALD